MSIQSISVSSHYLPDHHSRHAQQIEKAPFGAGIEMAATLEVRGEQTATNRAALASHNLSGKISVAVQQALLELQQRR